MPSSHDAPNAEIDRADRIAERPIGSALIALRVLADTGYGLWILQGAALALGIFRDGRGDSLVPLGLGALFVSFGLLLAAVRIPGVPAWHGWHPGRGRRPGSEALLAMAAYLPMLAVAGLTRGDNDFWPTRLAGATLLLVSLGCLIWHAENRRERRALSLSVGRVVAALYGGGLWLWACIAGGREVAGIGDPLSQPWLLLLLGMALLLGLLEGMRWHALRVPSAPSAVIEPVRLIAAVLTYVVPCLAVLFSDKSVSAGLAALIAATACLAGRMLERRLYARTLKRSAPYRTT